ncbi:MAG: ATP-dependent DNA helicase RecG [Alphaproteobacteria bacterium]|nr:ATP-dependent DNA helicase RecG [Alphaproteobacteria bacterium]
MRPDILTPLFRDISGLNGIGPKLSSYLKKLCGSTILDALMHLPVDVKKRTICTDVMPLNGSLSTLQVEVEEHIVPKIKRLPYVVKGQTNFGAIELVFFKYYGSYLTQKLPVGKRVWVSGKVDVVNASLKMIHPDYICFLPSDIPEYEVIYPLSAGMSGRILRSVIAQGLELLPDLPEEISGAVLESYRWPSWKEAIQIVHHPKTLQEFEATAPARMRLAYDELLANQAALLLVRQHIKQQGQKGQAYPHQKTFYLRLPFELTKAQQRCVDEISEDLASTERMSRLLQGDVGSGKTIVSVISALQVIAGGGQVALLAPTDILARQHFAKILEFLKGLDIKIALLTAREKGKERTQILSALVAGEISFIIGTHALLEKEVIFQKLGLAIVDEQHKFGVEQRLSLAQKSAGVNLLVMSATPIPRTLALTAYGDMDISILNEKPVGRQPILTRVLSERKISELVQKLKAQAQQIYWVCPLVAESEKTDLMAAEVRFKALQKVFGDKVGLIHGQMKADAKDAAMQAFVSGKIQVLVSTTVIEVGVDVPQAGIMVIEHAERFGMATLHQLRGRVGRGSDKAVCLLIHGRLSALAKERLAVLKDSNDGFKIAEADLRLRGAGEVLGVRQSGLPSFHFADLSEHAELLSMATAEVKQLLATDKNLTSSRGQALKNMLYLFQKDSAIHLLKAG